MSFQIHKTALTQLYAGNRLITDYLNAATELRPFYEYDFAEESFTSILSNRKRFATNRNLLADVLLEQYQPWITAETEKQINSLRNEKTFTVVASHQPCLLMGPIYNALKICSAIHLANRLRIQFPQQHFVPVFWLGSEDHDIAELNHTYINGERIAIDTTYTGPMGKMKSSEVVNCYSQHEALLRAQLGDDMYETVLQSAQRFETFGEHSQHLVHEIFGGYGLLVLDQNHVAFKKHFSSILADEVLQQRAIEVLKTSNEQLAANYHTQANPRAINCFFLSEEGRNRIEKQGNEYSVLNTSLRFSADEMLKLLSEHPEKFSPNVMLRPLYQELLLPNLAFVGGGGEVSYWLQLKPLFQHYGIHYPMLVVRSSAAFVSASLQRKISKLQLSHEQLMLNEAALQQSLLQSISNLEALNEERTELEQFFAKLEAKATATDATLSGAVKAELQKALKGLEQVESKLQRAEKRKHETVLQQLKQISDQLQPGGHPQERQLNLLPLLKDDDKIVQTLVDTLNPIEKAFVFFSAPKPQD